MRGDRPSVYPLDAGDNGFTPHARGSTYKDVQTNSWEEVYPACAGIDQEVTVAR